jgi:DNA mismatch repair ATPase MutS
VYLSTLESQQSANVQNPQGQLPFARAREESYGELRNAVDDLDPDTMSPREALDVLYKLKDL